MPGFLEENQIYVTVDLLPLTVAEGELRILLSRRPEAPCAGRWALFGKSVGAAQTAEDAARSLLSEMLPLEDVYLEQLYTFSELDRDPRGRVITIAHLAVLPWKRLQKALPREGLELFRLHMRSGQLCLTGEGGESLERDDLAFDHGRIVETGLLRLQGKLQYTDIGFYFLNDTESFTLGELQTVYEAVQGHPLDSGNFRRSMQSRYIDSGRMEGTAPAKSGSRRRGRPAVRYRLKACREENQQ